MTHSYAIRVDSNPAEVETSHTEEFQWRFSSGPQSSVYLVLPIVACSLNVVHSRDSSYYSVPCFVIHGPQTALEFHEPPGSESWRCTAKTVCEHLPLRCWFKPLTCSYNIIAQWWHQMSVTLVVGVQRMSWFVLCSVLLILDPVCWNQRILFKSAYCFILLPLRSRNFTPHVKYAEFRWIHVNF